MTMTAEHAAPVAQSADERPTGLVLASHRLGKIVLSGLSQDANELLDDGVRLDDLTTRLDEENSATGERRQRQGTWCIMAGAAVMVGGFLLARVSLVLLPIFGSPD